MEGIRPIELEKSRERMEAKMILTHLGLTLDDLKGKKTLDIGSGAGYLGKVAKDAGHEVISIDSDPYISIAAGIANNSPHHDFDLAYQTAKEEKLDTPLLVTGDAFTLPFKDESFDLLISYAGPINYTKMSTAEKMQLFNEARRVLKVGGEFRFGPNWSKDSPEEYGVESDEVTTNHLKLPEDDYSRQEEVTYYCFKK